MSGNQVRRKLLKINQVIQAITDRGNNDPNISIDYIRQILSEHPLSNNLISFVLQEPNQELTLEATCFFINVFGYNQIKTFIDTFPHLREAAVNLINTRLSRENFTQILNELGKLFTLADLLPECNNVIVNQLLSDTDLFLKYVKNYSLKLLADTYPDYKEQLIRKWLNNDKLSEDFIAFLLQESDLQITREILIYFLSQCTIDERKALMANFPHLLTAVEDYFKSDRSAELSLADKRTIIEGLFQQFPDHSTLDLAKLKKLITKHLFLKDVILEKVLNSNDLFLMVAPDRYALKNLADAFPDQVGHIIAKILSDTDLLLKFVSDNFDLKYWADDFPDQKNNIIAKVVNDTDLFLKFVFDDIGLKYLANAFPNHANHIISKVLNDTDLFLKLISNTTTTLLKYLADAFPDQAGHIIARVVNETDLFLKLVPNKYELKKLADAFPNHADYIIANVLNNTDLLLKLVSNNINLGCLAAAFPNHANHIISKVLNDTDLFLKLVPNRSELKELAHAFPDHANHIITKVLNETDLFLKFASHNIDLTFLAAEFFDDADLIIKKVLNDNGIFLKVFPVPLYFKYFLTHFPHYQAAIAETILVDHNIFNILCKNETYLDELQILFPHHKERFDRVFKVLNTPIRQLLADIQDMALFNELNSQLSKDVDFFLKRASNRHQLIELATAFPNHSENIILKILNDTDLFLKFIRGFNYLSSVTYLKELAEGFPDYADSIITKALNDKKIFLEIFRFPHQLESLLTRFPHYQTAIAEIILADHSLFNSLCEKNSHLDELQILFPHHKEKFSNAFKFWKKPLKQLLTDIITTKDTTLFNELNKQLSQSPACSAEEKRLLKEAKEHFLNLSKAQGLDAILKDNREWQDAKTQFLNHCEPTLVKKLVGFFKDNPDKELLEEAKKACPQDLKDLLDGPKLSEALRMA